MLREAGWSEQQIRARPGRCPRRHRWIGHRQEQDQATIGVSARPNQRPAKGAREQTQLTSATRAIAVAVGIWLVLWILKYVG